MKDELETIINRAIAGDKQAVCVLITRFRNMVYGLAISKLRDIHIAEDVAQEAMIELYRKIGDLKSPHAFSSWLRRIVLKHCDRMTRGKRLKFDFEDSDTLDSSTFAHDPSRVFVRKEMSGAAFRAVESLPEPYRETVILFYIEDFTQKEIAEFQDIPVSTVKKRLFDARKKLKDLFMSTIKETIKENALPESTAQKIMMFPFPRYAPQIKIVDTKEEVFEVKCLDAQSMFVPLEEGGECDWTFYDYPSRRLTGVNETKVISAKDWEDGKLLRIWDKYTDLQKNNKNTWKDYHFLVKDDKYKWVCVQRDLEGKAVVTDHQYKNEVSDWELRTLNKEYKAKDTCLQRVSLVTINEKTWKTLKLVLIVNDVCAEWYVAQNGRTVFFRRYNNEKAGRGSYAGELTYEDLAGNLEIEYNGVLYRHYYDSIPEFVL